MDRDPDGLYARLGVTPDAAPAGIHAAYRAKTKGPRPGPAAPDATAVTAALREAYDALRDPARRAAYDARGFRCATAAAGRVEPVCCARCGAVSAQPRYAVFPRVTSALVLCRRSASQGVRCAACAAREAGRAALWTLVLGWWSLQGLRRSPGAIRANLRGGEMPAEANAALLARQGLAFARRGEPRLAAACLRQAEAFARGEDADTVARLRRELYLDALARLRREVGVPDAAVKDAWASARPGLRWARTAPLAAAALALAAWWASILLRAPDPAGGGAKSGPGIAGTVAPPPTRQAAPPGANNGRAIGNADPSPSSMDGGADGHPNAGAGAATVRPPPAAPRYAYVLPGRGAAILRRGTETGPDDVARLPAFATVEVLGPAAAADPAHIQVRTAGGNIGRVEAARLGPGNGDAAQRRWCEDGVGAPPVHNEVAARRGRGPHRVTVNNYGDRWAAVKLRDEGHRTVLSVLVAPWSTAEVKDVPAGRFRVEFALGERWSRRCGAFLGGMQAQRFPDFNEFPAPPPPEGPRRERRYTAMHMTYTITPVVDGNVRAQDVSNEEFAGE